MTTQNIAQDTVSAAVAEPDQATFLRRILRADGVFSGLSGLGMVVTAGWLATFLGVSQPWVLITIGILLLLYSADLWYLAAQRSIGRYFTIATIAADVAWVLASWGIILLGWPALTTPGTWAVAIVADAVMVIAILKYVGLRRM